MWEWFKAGDLWMIPIAICSVFILGIIIERAIYLYGASINRDVFLATMQKCILAGDIPKAVKMCSAANVPLARIVQAGLVKVNRPDEEVQAAMDEAALRELPKINTRTPYLAMLSNFAVMAGLLGTISGMIKSFGSVGSDEGGNKAAMLAEGISEALNCTAFGIGTSLVGLLGYSMLQGKTTHVVDDINEVTVQVVNLVTSHRAQMQPTA